MRDSADRFEAANTVVLGASFDTPEENKSFAQLQEFDYRLLCDVDRAVGTVYEVARDADDKYASFPMRIAYLIDPDGIIRRSYEVSDVAGFADEVLADLTTLQS